jgi:hypothetical protein
MTVQAVDRDMLAKDGLGYCSTCKSICQLGDMVSEPKRKHRRRCKACHAERMRRTNREKALQYAAEWQKRGGPPILTAPLLPQQGLPIKPKLDQTLAV